MRVSHIIISAIIAITAASHGSAKTIILFNKKGHPINGYNGTKIQTGDLLKFNDGRSYEIISTLGHGNVNIIFKARLVPPEPGIPDVLALRLPISDSGKPGQLPPQDFINQSIDGYKILKKNEVPVPEMYKSLDGQYVASEFIEKDFSGHDFFTDPESLSKKYSPEVLQEAEEALVRFARFTVRFTELGDIGTGQLAYNIQTKTWTLLDWDNTHKLAKIKFNHSKANTFE